MYKENPKTANSGIICAIPQTGPCPNECPDCFFQSGRSYLEPLADNLPNMPSAAQAYGRIVRVNDGNDSNVCRQKVINDTAIYRDRFFNTAIPRDLDSFPGPVVLTVNPGKMTDVDFHIIDPIPANLMFVRARVNTWNLGLIDKIINDYSQREIPIVLTFMAYFDESIPSDHKHFYTFRKRTLNEYWAITTRGWQAVMKWYATNKWVHSCGKIEGEMGDTHCRFCGNCTREFYVTREKMKLADAQEKERERAGHICKCHEKGLTPDHECSGDSCHR